MHNTETLHWKCSVNTIRYTFYTLTHLHIYTFTNMNPAASGTMSMSYLKRHVYELRTTPLTYVLRHLQHTSLYVSFI